MLGEPETIIIDGKTFKVEPFTQRIQEAFEKYMQAHLLECVKSAKGKVDAEDYTGMLTEHFTAVAGGRYCFHSPRYQTFVRDINHLAELLWYCFSKHDDEVSKEWVTAWLLDHIDDALELYGRLSAISITVAEDGSKKK